MFCFVTRRAREQENTFMPCNKIVVKSMQTIRNTSSSATTLAEGSECAQSAWREVEQGGWETACMWHTSG